MLANALALAPDTDCGETSARLCRDAVAEAWRSSGRVFSIVITALNDNTPAVLDLVDETVFLGDPP